MSLNTYKEWGKSKLFKEAKALELPDNELWFEGYSIYLTAFSKIWLASKIFLPSFVPEEFNIEIYYKRLVYDWQIHHITLLDKGVKFPLPPQKHQFENAVKYYQTKGILLKPKSTNRFIKKLLRF